MVENTIKTLKILGFTEYEAKAYISLIGYGMATAREIHENSGVPQGRIYAVLKSLSDKKFIEIQNRNPSYYYADNPGAVLGKLKSQINESIDKSTEYLSNLHLNSKPPSMVWTIHSEWGIKNRAKTLIQNAENEILIIVNDYSYFKWMLPELKKLKRKINLEIYARNKSDFIGTNLKVSEYPKKMIEFEEKISSQKYKFDKKVVAKITMIIDNQTGFFIGIRDGEVTGVVLQVPEFVCTIREFMRILEDK